MRAPGPPEHVFIVGLPRTGSTLTRGILNASPEIWIAGESHYFDQPIRLGFGRRRGYRSRFKRAGLLTTTVGIQRIVDEIWGMQGKNFWARMARSTSRDAFVADLQASDRSERAFFDIALAHSARGRRIRGDKTPHHIHAVPTLLRWFPDSRVVHTFRDPRAIYASLRSKEDPARLGRVNRVARRLGPLFDLYATVNLARSWRQMAQLHRAYAARFPVQYRLIRFEDLIADPSSTAMELCAFVGVAYAPKMLDQAVHNSSYRPKGSTGGIDPTTAERWRYQLRPITQRWLSLLCRRELEAFGYPPR